MGKVSSSIVDFCFRFNLAEGISSPQRLVNVIRGSERSSSRPPVEVPVTAIRHRIGQVRLG